MKARWPVTEKTTGTSRIRYARCRRIRKRKNGYFL